MASCAVQIHYNGDDGCVFMYAFWMYGTVSCWASWTHRGYVCICVWLMFDAVWGRKYTVIMFCPNTRHIMATTVVHLSLLNIWNGVVFGADEKMVHTFIFELKARCYWCSMQYVLCDRILALMNCRITLQWRWRLCVECMKRCRAGADAQTVRFIGFEADVGVQWRMRWQSRPRSCADCPNTLQFQRRPTAVRSSSLNVCNGVVLGADEQAVRLYWCARLNLKVLLVFDAVCGSNLTLMCRPNTLQWRWWLCVYLRWLYGTAVCWASWTHSPYVCIGVWLNLKLLFICVRCSARSQSHRYVLSKYSTYNAGHGCSLIFVDCI